MSSSSSDANSDVPKEASSAATSQTPKPPQPPYQVTISRTTATPSTTFKTPAAPPQWPQAVSSGPAPGRHKVKVKHSLLDWSKLKASGQLPPRDGSLRVNKADLAKHNSPEDCWIAVNRRVYDITAFADYHPGGTAILHEVGGKDATKEFNDWHHYVNIVHMIGVCDIGALV